jgi:hypothetical protein
MVAAWRLPARHQRPCHSGHLVGECHGHHSSRLAQEQSPRWRYYISQAILQGRKQEAGSVARVPAMEIERGATEAVRVALFDFDRQRLSGSQRIGI